MTPSAHIRPKGIVFLATERAREVYDPRSLEKIQSDTEFLGVVAPGQIADHAAALAEAEVVFTGWGCGVFDAPLLAQMPRLKAIFYAGGTVKNWATAAVWERQIIVSGAYAANAIPVAEYTLGAILLSLKRAWHYVGRHQREKVYPLPVVDSPGGVGATIGVFSLGLIGRLVCEHLRQFDFNVLACDPLVTEAEAKTLGVKLVSLNELFARSNIVSLHAPLLPATTGIITGGLVTSLPPNSTLINTARGGLLRETEVAQVLANRPDLTALLDVLIDEPSPKEHPLLGLPNVFITPHIAGAMGEERWRLGRLMLEEFSRWRRGDPLKWQIRQEQLAQLA